MTTFDNDTLLACYKLPNNDQMKCSKTPSDKLQLSFTAISGASKSCHVHGTSILAANGKYFWIVGACGSTYTSYVYNMNTNAIQNGPSK